MKDWQKILEQLKMVKSNLRLSGYIRKMMKKGWEGLLPWLAHHLPDLTPWLLFALYDLDVMGEPITPSNLIIWQEKESWRKVTAFYQRSIAKYAQSDTKPQ